ncbi:hypothetical protein AUJ10_02220 [Candidatus Pacearchaeota archaeon CG1_02_31_27]|nr:MAG: hypothetical protein AUJ10_02220 [Candidatus Pacearchaeota archaeon CG1_02_31_27]PIN92534.1 MAG: hypothetical protein COU55_01885 [Candidatus Pacearchaeota archaeon CG10_big_fil_rev_8_21_14_0_10_31_59]
MLNKNGKVLIVLIIILIILTALAVVGFILYNNFTIKEYKMCFSKEKQTLPFNCSKIDDCVVQLKSLQLESNIPKFVEDFIIERALFCEYNKCQFKSFRGFDENIIQCNETETTEILKITPKIAIDYVKFLREKIN